MLWVHPAMSRKISAPPRLCVEKPSPHRAANINISIFRSAPCDAPYLENISIFPLDLWSLQAWRIFQHFNLSIFQSFPAFVFPLSRYSAFTRTNRPPHYFQLSTPKLLYTLHTTLSTISLLVQPVFERSVVFAFGDVWVHGLGQGLMGWRFR